MCVRVLYVTCVVAQASLRGRNLVASGCWKKLGCTLLLEETWLHVVAAGDGFFQALLQVVVVQAVFSIRI